MTTNFPVCGRPPSPSSSGPSDARARPLGYDSAQSEACE